MAAQFLTAQAIRIVTEKVMENVTRQMRQQADTPALLNAPSDVMAVLAGMHQQIVQTQAALSAAGGRLAELEAQIASLDGRTSAVESRWGWKLWGAIVGALAAAFALGFVAANLLRLFG